MMKNLRNDEKVYWETDEVCGNCTSADLSASLGVSPELWTYTNNAGNQLIITQHSSSKTQNFSFNIQNSSFIINCEHSPFCKITRTTGNIASRFAFRFSSEYFDTETGLVYYNYRYYSPELGRWLSRDPIGEKGGVNLYAMVGNSIVNWWDFLGMEIKGKYVSYDDISISMNIYHISYDRFEGKRQLLTRAGFIVWFEGGCRCKKGKPGTVVLVHKLFEHGNWVVDSGGKPKTDKWNGCGVVCTHQPGITDPKKDTGVDPGPHGPESLGPGSYYDSPSKEQTIRVEAYCRCDCEDDRLIDMKFFKYNLHGHANDSLERDTTQPLLY